MADTTSLQTIEQVADQLGAPVEDVRKIAIEALRSKNVESISPEQVELVLSQYHDRARRKPADNSRRRLSLSKNLNRADRKTTTVGGKEILVEGRKVRQTRPRIQKKSEVKPSVAASTKRTAPAPAPAAAKAIAKPKEYAAADAAVDDLLSRQQQTKVKADATVAEKASELAAAPKAVAKPSKRDRELARQATEKRSNRRARGTLTMDQTKVKARNQRQQIRRTAMKSLKKHVFRKPVSPQARIAEIGKTISVVDLAHRLAVKSEQIRAKAEELGAALEDDEQLDQETAIFIVEELGHIAKAAAADEPSEISKIRNTEGVELEARMPVVTVMGHVDHGKTSLLDRIRNSKVADSESGGITQHIGAYRVEHNDKNIVFLDTPGHAVFTEMRARGAQVTDIVILVVAADDGIMPQTIEAIDHARAAKVPIIVAVNKIDKPEAKPEQVRQELAGHGLQSEDWGGDTMIVDISAMAGTGIEKLLEAVLLTAEILELKAAVDVSARGTVIEAHTIKGIGTVVTGIVAAGKLKKGQMILCGTSYGRVRGLRDERGVQLDEAGPSMPVEIQGLTDMPDVGSEFLVVPNERAARDYAEDLRNAARENRLASHGIKLAHDADSWLEMASEDNEPKILNLIIKADVAGSAEAIKSAVGTIGNDEVSVRVLHCAVGGVTESDINLAATSDALIIGFRVSANAKARKMIEERRLKAKFHEVVYEVVDDVKAALEGMLDPEIEEKIAGMAEVRELFTVSKTGKVAGCAVTDGNMRSDLQIRIVREGKILTTDDIASLRHFKEEVAEVEAGSECGIHLRKFADFKVGDVFESVEVIQTAKVL